MRKPEYPSWVCMSCGEKYGNRRFGIATFHFGECGVCGNKNVEVTEPRDYGHLKSDWVNHNK